MPVGAIRKLPSTKTTSGMSSIMNSNDERSVATPPRSKVDLYSKRSIGSEPTIAISVLGANSFSGFTGRVGSSTFGVLSPEKFLMAMIKDNREGTSPGKLTDPGASPIIVKIEFISS